VKTSKGSHSSADSKAKEWELTKTSGYRTPEENKRVGGYSKSNHLTGNASDFAGPAKNMEAYAQWAAKSGQFKHVIYGGRDLVTGKKNNEHGDNVHVDW